MQDTSVSTMNYVTGLTPEARRAQYAREAEMRTPAMKVIAQYTRGLLSIEDLVGELAEIVIEQDAKDNPACPDCEMHGGHATECWQTIMASQLTEAGWTFNPTDWEGTRTAWQRLIATGWKPASCPD